MRNLNLISSNFMPVILDLLKDDEISGRFLPLDIWAVDEYFVPREYPHLINVDITAHT